MVSREELYELVWAKPMTRVAEQFKVSGSFMARVCANLNVPRPQRGYWAKLAVGKASAKPPLPEALPGDQLFWSREGDVYSRPKPRCPPTLRQTAKIRVPRTRIHGLIRGAKEHFEAGRPVEDGDYLNPYKKLLVDVTASKAHLNKALGFANDLFNALESVGHRVLLAPAHEGLSRMSIEEREERSKQHDYRRPSLWSPHRPTVVYIGTVAIGLAIIEMSAKVLLRYVGDGKYIREADYRPSRLPRYTDHTWTTTKDLPSGCLRLVAYSPYQRVAWSADWQETKRISLKASLLAIVKTIENSAAALVAKLEEAERLAEIERRRWLAKEQKRRREEDRRRVEQSIQESHEHLRKIIGKWSEVMDVEQFLTGVEKHAARLSEIEKVSLLDRLKLAREFLGTQNPLDFFLSWKAPGELYRPLYLEADEFSENGDGTGLEDQEEVID